MTGPDRVEQFRVDIAASPDAFERLLDAQAAAPIEAIDHAQRICCTGLGSSRFAAEIVVGRLRAEGRSAWAELASTDQTAATAPAADLTLVAISASGRTPEVIAAAQRHRGTSRVVAITNDPASPLAAVADAVVPLHAGPEASGIACRTFRATLAALALLTGTAEVAELRPLVSALRARLATSRAWVRSAADALDGAPAIDVLADAALAGLAGQAALMLREAPRLPAHAGATGEWLHVGVYLAWPGLVVLRYPGDAADGELVRVLRARGATLVDVPPTGGPGLATPLASAIVSSLDAELLATELWSRSSASAPNDKAP